MVVAVSKHLQNRDTQKYFLILYIMYVNVKLKLLFYKTYILLYVITDNKDYCKFFFFYLELLQIIFMFNVTKNMVKILNK